MLNRVSLGVSLVYCLLSHGQNTRLAHSCSEMRSEVHNMLLASMHGALMIYRHRLRVPCAVSLWQESCLSNILSTSDFISDFGVDQSAEYIRAISPAELGNPPASIY